MLVFHSHCQMGNQMFIYACARSIAKTKSSSYCISGIRDLKYFKLTYNDFLFNKLRYTIFKISNFFKKFTFCHFQNNFDDHSQKMIITKANNIWYYGYFQSEKYFFNNTNEIRSLFKIKNKYIKIYDQIIKELNISNLNRIVVHVRLTDYASSGSDEIGGKDLRISLSYYHNLVKKYNLKSNFFVFVSDDINFVKHEFSYLKNAYFSENSSIIDFQFLLNSKVSIIGPSSFAWWASWLNTKNDKKIYVPKYWLGHKIKKEYPVNIIPKNWEQITV